MTDNPLAGILSALRRWWWLVVGLVVLAVGLTFLTLPDAEPGQPEAAVEFRATHLLIRDTSAPTQLTFDLIVLLARQGDLTNRIAERLDTTATEVEAITLVTDPVTDTMTVTAVRPTADEAALFATTYANELVTFLDERTRATVEADFGRVTERLLAVEASIEDLEREIVALPEGDVDRLLLEADLASLLEEFSALRSQQRSLESQRTGQAASFTTLEEPSPVPTELEGIALPTRPLLRLVLAGVLGVLLGLALVIVLDRVDTRVRTRRQAEDAFGLPVVAELPKLPKRHRQRHPLPTFDDPGGVTAEILRALRLTVSLAPTWRLSSLARDGDGPVGTKEPVKLDGDPRSIVVTSALSSEGKSTLAANLAVSIAEGGRRVLVVDCDFRRPAIGRILDVEPGLGLRELTRVSERPLRELASPAVAPNVAMVRSGSRGVTPPWFLGQADQLVERCLELADVVIFDTGPVLLTNEAAALLPHVDTSLLAVRVGKPSTENARSVVEQLTQVDAHVTGVVLIGTSGRRRYGYYRHDGKDDPQVAVADGQNTRTRVDAGDEAALWGSNKADGDAPSDDHPVGGGRPPRRSAARSGGTTDT